METVDKPTINILCGLLRHYGVRHAVISSGSRCAPVSTALARFGGFELHPVIDERSAAFTGLGIALATDEPVALVCTSGSAPLNYAPALAEAYYRRVPLIAVTADRPARYIDQREGQTIHQAGALDAIVRKSVDLEPDDFTTRSADEANRLICSALNAATGVIKGPVHINVQIEVPLTPMTDASTLPEARAPQAGNIACKKHDTSRTVFPEKAKVLLIIGGIRLDADDLRALAELKDRADVAVLSEIQNNVPGAIPPMWCDRVLDRAPTPDMVAIVGGDMVSNRFKAWLRRLEGVPFVSGCFEDVTVDTFGHLSEHIDCSPADFFRMLANGRKPGDYRHQWQILADEGRESYPLSNPAAHIVSRLADLFRAGDLHVSNGSAARIAQLARWAPDVRIEMNRGVSGIEGSTSTAVGSAIASGRPTLLISGDMSAAYDIAAFANPYMPGTFKMAILDNCGGDIFRNIPTTAQLPELEELFAMPPFFPIEKLANAYGIQYFSCKAADDASIESFINSGRASVLHIKLDPKHNKGLI